MAAFFQLPTQVSSQHRTSLVAVSAPAQGLTAAVPQARSARSISQARTGAAREAAAGGHAVNASLVPPGHRQPWAAAQPPLRRCRERQHEPAAPRRQGQGLAQGRAAAARLRRSWQDPQRRLGLASGHSSGTSQIRWSLAPDVPLMRWPPVALLVPEGGRKCVVVCVRSGCRRVQKGAS